VLVMRMHNINFHKRRALYMKHVPDMSKDHQRMYEILPEQEPKVTTVEEEVEFVERVIREREEAQVRAPRSQSRREPHMILKCLISLCTNPVSILSVLLKPSLNPLNRLNAIFV
jgi:hypothetical protein